MSVCVCVCVCVCDVAHHGVYRRTEVQVSRELFRAARLLGVHLPVPRLGLLAGAFLAPGFSSCARRSTTAGQLRARPPATTRRSCSVSCCSAASSRCRTCQRSSVSAGELGGRLVRQRKERARAVLRLQRGRLEVIRHEPLELVQTLPWARLVAHRLLGARHGANRDLHGEQRAAGAHSQPQLQVAPPVDADDLLR